MEKNTETTLEYWGYIGMMENKMDTTILINTHGIGVYMGLGVGSLFAIGLANSQIMMMRYRGLPSFLVCTGLQGNVCMYMIYLDLQAATTYRTIPTCGIDCSRHNGDPVVEYLRIWLRSKSDTGFGGVHDC